MIPVSAGVRIWIASGHTDMRKGMNGVALPLAVIRSRATSSCSVDSNSG